MQENNLKKIFDEKYIERKKVKFLRLIIIIDGAILFGRRYVHDNTLESCKFSQLCFRFGISKKVQENNLKKVFDEKYIERKKVKFLKLIIIIDGAIFQVLHQGTLSMVSAC